MDILEQVKQHANRSVEETIMSGVPLHPKWFQMVVDEIERLKEENRKQALDLLARDGQLFDEIERLREEIKSITGHGVEQMEKIERLREERSRLRETLNDIAKLGPDGELWNTKAEIWMIAEAALKGDE